VDMNSSLVRRSTNHIACDMDGEVVILDLQSGTYYGLDVVGASVWTLIEQPVCLGAIREAIMSEYDVDAETCDRDILAFLDKMQAVGLVEVSNGAIL
jgi:Coenzyme PQQ synthesis protein D (PqqD)